jgi:hypothetical protein
MDLDLDSWSERDLRRYYALVAKARDAQVFPEVTLSADECRELEIFRLGIAEREDATPAPLVDASPIEYDKSVPAVVAPPAPAPAPAPAPVDADDDVPLEPCPYCGGPCVGPDHPSYGVLHYNDPEEAERRRDDQQRREERTRQMWRQFGITPPRY